jgi:DNA primase catalytic core
MNPDFDQIKKTTDIAAVIQRHGVALKQQGADYVGLCPFHDDHNPSLRVTPAKGLFHCMACGAAGNAIQFVAKKENLTVKEAALRLMGNMPGVQRGSEMVQPAPSAPAQHPELFNAIIEHYHQALLGRNRRGLDYLKARGFGDTATLAHFKIGYVDHTLKTKLTPAQVKLAQGLGIFNDKRTEKFWNRVVVPIFDESGQPVGLCGRDITGEMEHKYINLAGEQRGVWNSGAAAAYPDELILTEGIFDGLALWQAGKKNVIAVCGVKGWLPLHTALLQKHSVCKVVLAFDQDEPGKEAVQKLTPELTALGVHVHRLRWPEGIHDACDYFQYTKALDFQGTPDTFAALLSSAPRIGHTREKTVRLSMVEKTDDTALFQNGNVAYRVKGIDQSHLRIVLDAKTATARHIDHLDLYASRSRKLFSSACADRLGLEAGKIEEDLLALLELVEALQRQQAAPVDAKPTMTDDEEKAARAFLQTPKLLDRIAADLELVGYVGEARIKKLAYLVGTSRRLPKPLSGIFRAQSGSGKSYLMECVAELMPPEDVLYFSRLTPQALYYLEPDALVHKLLIVDERDGSEQAEYSIRTLQTKKRLALAVPIKDPNSGKMKTMTVEVHGPIAYMESTTDEHINDENANRCFELYLDESPKQTEAIFAAQRQARTLEGWQVECRKENILRVHHAAQRLLRPLKVIIPYVKLIAYPSTWTGVRGRRDYDRLLSLIEGSAFLHQHQRKIGSLNGASGPSGKDYIEATLEDYAHAYDLAHQVFAQAGSDLPKPVADFYARVKEIMRGRARASKCRIDDLTFSRRDIRAATEWPDHIVKRHMRRLEDLEYVQVQRAPQGGSFVYRLLPDVAAPVKMAGLILPETLEEEWDKWNRVGQRSMSQLRNGK